MDLALRPRSATELVDAAVRLFRQHFGAFITLALVAAVPRLAIAGAQLALFGGVAMAANPFAMFSGTYFLLLFASLLVAGVFEGAFVSLADEALRTGTATPGSALSRGMARAVPVLVTFVIVAVVVTFGLALFVAPGIYLGLRLYPAVATAALEGVGPGEALARAWRRTSGAVGRAFVMYLVIFVLVVLVGFAGSLVGGVLGGIAGGVTGGGGSGRAAVGALVVAALVQVLVGVLYYPLLSAAATLFYYDTRVRSEGLDVELMADALGGRPGAAAY